MEIQQWDMSLNPFGLETQSKLGANWWCLLRPSLLTLGVVCMLGRLDKTTLEQTGKMKLGGGAAMMPAQVPYLSSKCSASQRPDVSPPHIRGLFVWSVFNSFGSWANLTPGAAELPAADAEPVKRGRCQNLGSPNAGGWGGREGGREPLSR